MNRLLKGVCVAGALALGVPMAQARDLNFKMHKTDWRPFAKYPKLYKEFKELRDLPNPTVVQYERMKAITLQVHEKEPKWFDGRWIAMDYIMKLASGFNKEEDLPYARKLYSKAIEMAEACMKDRPNSPICKFYMGAAIGSRATIDGVFSSLRHAEDVERYFTEVYNSDINVRYHEGWTLQGMNSYALGIFNRVLPDSFLLDLFFNVRGNIDKSIAFHREVLKIDGDGYACNNIMLAAALMCKTEGEASNETSEAQKWLKHNLALEKSSNLTEQNCQMDSNRMMADPSLACGYTTSKQQEEMDEEQLKKNQS